MSTVSPVNPGSAIPTEAAVATSFRNVKVHGVRLKGLFSVLGVFKRLGLSIPAGALSAADFVDFQELTKGLESLPAEDRVSRFSERVQMASATLSPEQRQAIEDSVKRRTADVLQWLFSVEELLTAVLCGISDLTAEECGQLSPAEVVKIVDTATQLTDVPGTIQVGLDFFSRIGGHMAEYDRRKAPPASAG